MISRRDMLSGAAAVAVATSKALAADGAPVTAGVPAGTAGEATLDALPGKQPLIKLSYRPPNYETPIAHFRQTITPNDAFFVRYHLSDIPEVDAQKWTLKVGGATPLSLDLATLKRDFPAVEIVAVCQCSGNRRGLSAPHVAGVQWGYGAMGNARWKGARLKDILAKAGIAPDTVEIVVNGADRGASDKTPDFIKSLPLWKAIDDNTIVAYEMNGAPLPHWNGFPARLVVPGWTATYWMKHLTEITPAAKPFDGFWMKSAYRVPVGLFPSIDRFVTQETPANTPITEMMVNSLVTSHADGDKAAAGTPLTLSGIAWDGGRGIARVEVSLDGGATWRQARLGDDLGRFSFRPWSLAVDAPPKGKMAVLVNATNAAGQSQVATAIFNPPGYHHNVMHKISIEIG